MHRFMDAINGEDGTRLLALISRLGGLGRRPVVRPHTQQSEEMKWVSSFSGKSARNSKRIPAEQSRCCRSSANAVNKRDTRASH